MPVSTATLGRSHCCVWRVNKLSRNTTHLRVCEASDNVAERIWGAMGCGIGKDENIARRLPDSKTLRDGALTDVSPTLLHLLGIAQPAEMTGRSLVD